MSLASIWFRKHAYQVKRSIIGEVLHEDTHWMVTVWLFDNSVEDEHVDPNGRKACDWADDGDAAFGRFTWHARDWKLSNDDTLQEKLTCKTCWEMYMSL